VSIDTKQIQKLATLSRLKFSDDELAAFADKFQNIITFVEEIQAVKTEGVQPLTSTVAGASTPERPDAVTEQNRRERHQSVAPQTEEGFYVVPRVVE
jgi:aspartyl-tRNA(Asn)/glutamyl-tRNA(Gln) amidotransferase subunit C